MWVFKRKNRSRKQGKSPLCQEEQPSPAQDEAAPEDWAGPGGPIGEYIRGESEKTRDAYRSQPNLVTEHANHEEDTARGGYARRQLFELVQNGADALAGSQNGRILIRLTPERLYCADNGLPVDSDGVKALMFSHLSPKRGTDEIGRFGLGFKSVLGVTDTPEFFSRSGSFRFNRKRAAELIRPISPGADRYPVLRLPEAIDPSNESETDAILRELMGWARNIIRLPLKPEAHESLRRQIEDFPMEFLLFVEHVSNLILRIDRSKYERTATLSREDDLRVLHNGKNVTRWFMVKRKHSLSPDAKSDTRSLDDADQVPISWAAPVNGLNDQGKFWAFFPTMTPSLLSGILNAPWKTNEDRQNLLPGIYNDELIDAASVMVANSLARLSSLDDPARHLEALPRREEAGDPEHSNRLRKTLYQKLRDQRIAPDQNGALRKVTDLSYPPSELPNDALKRWSECDQRPRNWLHHSAVNRNRLARLNRLYEETGPHPFTATLPRASIAEWLEALALRAKGRRTDNEASVQASMAAIQTAALIPEQIRRANNLGVIVLTAGGKWVKPDPDTVRLGGGEAPAATTLVHPQLEADPQTLDALKKLGIRPASPASVFKDMASTLLVWNLNSPTAEQIDKDWREFWRLARDVDPATAAGIVREYTGWPDLLRVRTRAGNWRAVFEALLPGPIIPADDGRDDDVAIDTQFHEKNLTLLSLLDAVQAPREKYSMSSDRYQKFIDARRPKYQDFAYSHSSKRPQLNKLTFTNPATGGPLDVLERLSEEGKALYTWSLLDLGDVYEPWIMRHETQDLYPLKKFKSPALGVLRRHGRVKTDEGIRALSTGLGDPPQDPAVLKKLLSHPKARLIRKAFGLPDEKDLPWEPVNAEEPALLIDVWPGLEPFLTLQQAELELARCDGFRRLGRLLASYAPDCVNLDNAIYVIRKDDEQDELRAVLKNLGLPDTTERIDQIIRQLTPEKIKKARLEVSSHSTDEERLLAAVGRDALLQRLPQGLVDILSQSQGPLTGVQVAQAAIATFHTGALREYRDALGSLGPPRQWAGTPKAVEFVRSLGFGEEWAGERNARRDPYVEVEGPYSLPQLHDYQSKIVENVRDLIRSGGTLGGRRGMISMPTGSGKTRVAVQAIVEAMREDEFAGGVLWVADRDELCEQAVEAWRQVWASEGSQATRLRISRMWASQPPPMPTGHMHVIVATIQTLSSRMDRLSETYQFLSYFKLLVFDEAHRSVSPTSTSVMRELGLTRLRRSTGPVLIGLTATPYRGHDERETARLVNRYGRNRLDAGAFLSDDPEDVIRRLQSMRVLAQADHDTIEGGSFDLSDDELRQSIQTPWLPRSVENRIAYDTTRTQRIVEAYMDQVHKGGPEWPTLIFATSVEHSQTVAALLTSKGVRARAVSAETDTATRRRIVEEFRAGEVKALVNYGIFREGFDAPKTRAIIVARPVYSPNLYFQMIGRGLRGVKNGGNDRCLILNVKDNINNFRRKLAFSDLDWLWA